MKNYIYVFALILLLFNCSSNDDNNNSEPEQGTITDINKLGKSRGY